MLTNKLTGAGASGKTYIEDVFSTYLYKGNSSTQTINNGIDLAGKGGLTWFGSRNAYLGMQHYLIDSARGIGNTLNSHSQNAQAAFFNGVNSYASTGVVLNSGDVNASNNDSVIWTFRKAPKFFDVVTYTGNGAAGRTILHSLGSVPGMIIIKKTNGTAGWFVYHQSLGNQRTIQLESNLASYVSAWAWNNTSPTASVFTVGNDNSVNASGGNYVAYLFAHDTTQDGLIQCGNYTGNNAGAVDIYLGWEPQYLIIKKTSGTGDWQIIDNMRGMPVGYADNTLQANLSNAESSVDCVSPTATGFQATAVNAIDNPVNEGGHSYIYMAIRRGPMRTPISGATVFSPNTWIGNNIAGTNISTGFPVDFTIEQVRTPSYAQSSFFIDRLRGYSSKAQGITAILNASSETGTTYYNYVPTMNGFYLGANASSANQYNNSSISAVGWNFRRAPGFFDIVCYTGTGVARTINHNLGVAPELMIVKARNTTGNWSVYNSSLGNTAYLSLNLANAKAIDNIWNNQSPSSAVFSVGANPLSNSSGSTYVSYLFATCPGVSKVGSYTGNGSSQTINCGFTAGARFVLIKRTDSTDNWYVWDTARGIVSANDPTLMLNVLAAEATTSDPIDPNSAGFIVNQGINVSSATYIYLAIA